MAWIPLLFCLLALTSSIACFPVSNDGQGIELTVDAWVKHGVDSWLPNFIKDRQIPTKNILEAFPRAVGFSMKCGLYDDPCYYSSTLHSSSTEEEIRIALVLASLTHFNDLFRMFNKLVTPDEDIGELQHRSNSVSLFGNMYFYYNPTDLNSTIPAKEFAQILFTPIWYIPNAIPNDALKTVVDDAIKACAENGFGYAWKDYQSKPAHGSQVSNIEQSYQAAFQAWGQQYESVVQAKGNTTVLDFLKGGSMLKLRYAKEMTDLKWHQQAYRMFTRQVLNMIYSANGMVIHRASYETMQPEDAAIGLNGWHDDPYDHVIYGMVSWGLDIDGNLTEQYAPRASFDAIDIADRVIFGQAYTCWATSNSNSFTNNYQKAWELPAFEKSLYIPDWDGTGDGFDEHNPTCTFNLPVNNQSANIKESWFMEDLKTSCPAAVWFDEAVWSGSASPDVYRSFMVASDAWLSTLVAIQATDPDTPAKLTDFCSTSADSAKTFGKALGTDIWHSFRMNVVLGLVFGASDAFASLKGTYNSASSWVKGVWSKYQMKPAVIDHPPPEPLNGPDRGSDAGHQSSEPDKPNEPDKGDEIPKNHDDKPGALLRPGSGKSKGDAVEKPGADDHSDNQPHHGEKGPDGGFGDLVSQGQLIAAHMDEGLGQ